MIIKCPICKKEFNKPSHRNKHVKDAHRMKTYELGNALRGYYKGDFDNIETAWRVLSYRFLTSFPSQTGRQVSMSVREINSYDIMQWSVCKQGVTSLESATVQELQKCGCH